MPPAVANPPTPQDIDSFYQFKIKQYGDFAQTLLIAATFAGAITLSKALDNTSTQNINDNGLLAWASSIFVASIMGCVMIIISVKLDVPFGIVQFEVVVVSFLVTAGFYLLIATPLFRNSHEAAFIFGTVFYWLFFLIALHFSILSALHYSLVEYPKLEKYAVDVYIERKRGEMAKAGRALL
ncbi:hypothetical protein MGU_10502 [Metarhizium guizhouense ARSEF 977]|uniref:Uncharacterized protein n=1 Tax=Metarhizium guizhouense (strain ARSEF 977) TaxID=1276136 RepID=A0A0B4GQZ9_METGA|nr:hypothetical protein MGU_10502 [Metarhizium guizhouense ARSEF 977]